MPPGLPNRPPLAMRLWLARRSGRGGGGDGVHAAAGDRLSGRTMSMHSLENMVRSRVRMFLRHTTLVTLLGTVVAGALIWAGVHYSLQDAVMRVAVGPPESANAKFVDVLDQDRRRQSRPNEDRHRADRRRGRVRASPRQGTSRSRRGADDRRQIAGLACGGDPAAERDGVYRARASSAATSPSPRHDSRKGHQTHSGARQRRQRRQGRKGRSKFKRQLQPPQAPTTAPAPRARRPPQNPPKVATMTTRTIWMIPTNRPTIPKPKK